MPPGADVAGDLGSGLVESEGEPGLGGGEGGFEAGGTAPRMATCGGG
ncbi:MAG TPA: hypothetical protein VGR07_18455 [Thermoanaerobaculia bacterium]|nr:hypothetical protein [Thermoanaerobaculia bacterium]